MWWSAIAVLAISEVTGMAALVSSYSIAQNIKTGEAEFVLFWLGMALIELPVIAVIARKATPQAVRMATLVFLGVVSYAPKLLRDPSAPAFHDEFAHWRETYDIVATGKLFNQSEIVTIISRYPGLHSAVAAIVNITGLSIWQAAALLLLLLHLSLLLGVAALAQAIGLNSRACALAAIIYSFNSAFLYFDTQFAYESMAITLVVWALFAFVRAIRCNSWQERAAWSCLTALLSAATVITHHLSAIDLTIVMALVSLALSVPLLARREGWSKTATTAWGLTAFAGIAIGSWIYFIAPGTVSYLSPYFGTGLTELMQVAGGSSSGRQLFAASLSPWWEHYAAFMVTAFMLCAAIAGLLLFRGRARKQLVPSGRPRVILLAFAILGLVYFPSTLFILSPAGSEGARRSWEITWIGLAMLAGPVVGWIIDWSAQRTRLLHRISVRSVLVGILVISLVGGTAAGLDPSYRFPGPFLYGSDTRSETPELNAMSQWFLSRFGSGNNVVTDRYTGLIISSYGLQNTANPSPGFPVYDLYLDKPGEPVGPAWLVEELGSSHYLYLIVDSRMADNAPHVGVFFEPDEPTSFVLPNGQSIFKGRLGKFTTVSWMEQVFQSDNYSVYRMNLPAAGGAYQNSRVDYHGELEVGK